MGIQSTSRKYEATPDRLRRRNLLYSICFEERSRRQALLVLGMLASLVVAVIAFFSFQSEIPYYDRLITRSIQSYESGAFTGVMELVSAPGYGPWNVLLVLGICLLVALWLGWQVGLFLLLVSVLQGVVTVLLKFPIRQARPMETDLNAPFAIIAESSFPSGHVTMYVVLFGFLLYLMFKHGAPSLVRALTGVVSAFLLLLIGPSRIHLGAHWVGDVVAAYLIGCFILLLAIDVYEQQLLPRLLCGPADADPGA